MIILGSYGFGYYIGRPKLSELIKDRSGKMLIIPLASSDEQRAGERETRGAVEAGFQRDNIFVFDKENEDGLLDKDYDHIVVLGGNTFKLLYYVKALGLDRFIKEQVERGAAYLGFSAGAYIACRDIEYVKIFDDNNHIADGDFSALGLTDDYVLCHYDSGRGYEEIRMCRDFIGYENRLRTINDDQFILLE